MLSLYFVTIGADARTHPGIGDLARKRSRSLLL